MRRVAAFRTLARVGRFVRPYRRQVAYAAVALVFAAAAVLAIGQGLRFVIDRGFVAGSAAELDRALASCSASHRRHGGRDVHALLLRVVAGRARHGGPAPRGVRSPAALPPGFFEVTRTGEVISRLTNDTTMLETVIGSSLSMAVRNLLLLVGGLVMLALTSAKLTLLVLAGVPLVVAPIILFGRRVRRLSRASQDRVGDVGAYVDEALHEIRTVQAYGHEHDDRARFGERVEDVFAAARRRIRQRALLVATVIVLAFGAVGIILWIGGHDVVAGRITPGPAVGVRVLRGDRRERRRHDQRGHRRCAARGRRDRAAVRTARGRARRFARPRIRFPCRARRGHGRVRGRDVPLSVAARTRRRSIDFSLAIDAGERVALVGPSGAGKTTVFQLLLRFYDPQSGVVRIDGVDVARADPAQVRGRLALVPQDPVIFSTSVLENVRYGRPDATDARGARGVRGRLRHRVHRAPAGGYASELGERGVRLSGGQRQRLAIARAILADRPILLLDEATSALDAESERMVQHALERLMAGRTVLMIAHRLATVRNADRIAVLDRGRIVAIGPHDGSGATARCTRDSLRSSSAGPRQGRFWNLTPNSRPLPS